MGKHGRESAGASPRWPDSGEDADHSGAALGLLVEPFKQVGCLQVLMVLTWEPGEVQRLADGSRPNR